MSRVAIILAAGVGSRLRPLTDYQPKCMLDVGGKTLLLRLVGGLASWADQIVVVSGHGDSALRAYLKSEALLEGITVVHNDLYCETNSMASVATAQPHWGQAAEVVVSNSDVFFAGGALDAFLAANADMTAAVVPKPWDPEDMKVEIDDAEQRLLAVSKEIPPDRSFGEFTGLFKVRGQGVAIFERTIRRMLKDPIMVRNGWYDLAVDRIAREGHRVTYRLLSDSDYAEIDTLGDLEAARAQFSAHATKCAN